MKKIACIFLAGLLMTLTACQSSTGKEEGSALKQNETKPLTRNDVLTLENGVFMLEGQPFAEISVNKFDLMWQLIDPLLQGDQDTHDWMLIQQRDTLKELKELGFRSVRVFMTPWAPADFKTAWDNGSESNLLFIVADEVVKMFEELDMKIVWCMGVTGFVEKWIVNDANGWHWEYGEDQQRELIGDENCEARQRMYRYIDAVVQRYKGSRAVLTWEIANEVTLDADIMPDTKIYEDQRMPNIQQVSDFFRQVSERIHQNDPLRLVNSGGSCMRTTQWNQYVNNSWQKDTQEEQYQALELLYKDSACDIIDIHWYVNEKEGEEVLDNSTKQPMFLKLSHYVEFARRLNKPLMIGEIGLLPGDASGYFTGYDDVEAAKPYFQRQLDEIVDSGVQLAYWWAYGSDRPGDDLPGGFSLKKGLNDELVQMIVDANQRLKAKFNAP